ncbi:hypothetical protein C8R43DRAFT_952798 [Mycena crocata]|nr:hypothetical protein C8R43DRAFT_952798 [Mycena crocata]
MDSGGDESDIDMSDAERRLEAFSTRYPPTPVLDAVENLSDAEESEFGVDELEEISRLFEHSFFAHSEAGDSVDANDLTSLDSLSDVSEDYVPPETDLLTPPDLDLPTALDATDQWRLSPARFTQIHSNLSTLSHGAWIDSILIDVFTTLRWLRVDLRPQVSYVPIHYSRSYRLLTEDEIDNFRRLFSLPDGNGQMWVTTLLFVGQNHYGVLLGNMVTGDILILGAKAFSDSTEKVTREEWEEWDGPRIWTTVCQLHGVLCAPRNIVGFNWTQNGYDCGADAAYLLQALAANGVASSTRTLIWNPPPLPCGHLLRLHAATKLHEYLTAAIEEYMMLLNGPQSVLLDPWEENSRLELLGGDLDSVFISAAASLHDAMDSCPRCRQHARRTDTNRPRHLADIFKKHPMIGPGARQVHIGDHDVSSDEEPDDDASDSDDPTQGDHWKTNNQRVGDVTLASAGRFPREFEPKPLPPQPIRGAFLPFDHNYDEYDGGPPLSTTDRVSDELAHMTERPNLFHTLQGSTIAPWMTWTDRGWRLPVTFAQAFHNRPPVAVANHLIPQLPSPSRDPDMANLTRRGDPIQTTGCVELGLQQTLNHLFQNPDANLLVSGTFDLDHIPAGPHNFADYSALNHLKINPERDRKAPSGGVSVSADIDSAIWVARKPRFGRKFSLYMAPCPPMGNKPPIHKHNHIYIDILLPPSDESVHARVLDLEANGSHRSEWWKKRFKMSQIPHMTFGHVQPANLYIFFPRMIHRRPFSAFWATLIPRYIQNLFYDELFIPAVRDVVPAHVRVFTGLSRDHQKYKQGDKETGLPQLFPFTPNEILRILDVMEKKMKENPTRLGIFGSSFFVLEIKGCKAWTSVIGPTYNEPEPGASPTSSHALGLGSTPSEDRFRSPDVTTAEEALSKAMGLFWAHNPSLSRNEMLNRERGELFLDFGLTFHPYQHTGLVGLWNLADLETSFGAAGYNLGTLHRLSNLDQYGGLMAEMNKPHSQQSHVAFQTAYSLCYQVVRQRTNTVNFFQLQDVYECGEAFRKEVFRMSSIFKEVTEDVETSYGVRREFRIGGGAMLDSIQAIDGMARYIAESSTAILWISSKTWFKFISARLHALYDLQQQFASIKPPNFITLSGLVAFMLQSLNSTPQRVESFVRRALGLVRFDGVMSRYGMFFLHNLEITHPTVIPEIDEVDAPELKRFVDTYVKSHRPRVQKKGKIAPDTSSNEKSLGTPSFSEFSEILLHQPHLAVRDWHFPPDLEEYSTAMRDNVMYHACEVFSTFTRMVWFLLHPAHQIEPDGRIPLNNVRDTLEFWSVRSMISRLHNPRFIACNAGVPGATGRQTEPFGSHKRVLSIFVPENEAVISKVEETYLAMYQETIRSLAVDTGDNSEEELQKHLGVLMSHCQCLPNSSDSAIWTSSDTGGNPQAWIYLPIPLSIPSMDSVPARIGRGRRVPNYISTLQITRKESSSWITQISRHIRRETLFKASIERVHTGMRVAEAGVAVVAVDREEELVRKMGIGSERMRP